MADLDIRVTELTPDQIAGVRCAVCNTDFWVASMSGPGYDLPSRRITIKSYELKICTAHGHILSEVAASPSLSGVKPRDT